MTIVERVAQVRDTVTRWFWPLQGPYTSVLITDATGLGQIPVSGATALAIGAVYRALSIYSDLISTMPVHRLRGEWERMPTPPFVDHPTGIPIGWTDEIGQVIWSLLLRGNAYLVVTSLDWTNYPATFYVADPDSIAVERLSNGDLQYRLRVDNVSANDLVWINPYPDQLLHLRWQTPPGAICGVGILDAGGGPSGEFAGAVSTTRYAADLMANPIPPAVIEHPARLNAQQAVDLQDQWATSVGRSRAIPAVLSGGIKFTPLTLTANDVQLIEARRWNATNVATWFGLPPYMVGGETGSSMTYATVEGENTRLWTDALQPMATRLERGFGAWTPNGQRLRFIPDAILRSQTLDRFNAHKIAIDTGFETVDEVRALENLPPMVVQETAEVAQVPAALPAPVQATPQLPAGGS